MLKFESELSYENAEEIVERIRERLLNQPRELVLDLGGADHIDSSGLRALIQARKLCQDAGVKFKIGKISECAERVIRIGGFADILGITESRHTGKIPNGHADIDESKCRNYEYVVASDPSMIAVLRNKAYEIAQEAGAAGDTLCDIQIAVGEALTNAYRHGSPDKSVNKISMRCKVCPKAIIIEIEDEGLPFDPKATSDPDPKILRDHGMGIFLMKQAMDEVEFEFNMPGNKVRMVKRLPI